jgi:tRNA-2-methylthio-N6-dimethylallyladenosine synthase
MYYAVLYYLKMRKEKQTLKYYIRTFGCQMNANDSERLAGQLATFGMEPAHSAEESDLIIVNSCAVREKSEEKMYSLLGRFESIKKKKQTLIGVVGCVAQLHSSKLWDKKPFIDFILGPDNYWQIPHLLPFEQGEKVAATQRSLQWHEIPSHQTIREDRRSAYITIMEGCNNFCAYCVVPFTRGREKYRPLSSVLDEAKNLAVKGYKEIQLLGQNVNSYKDPVTGSLFSDLLKEVNRIDGIEWIRFITSHPKDFTEKIAITMKEAQKVCHHLHLPVQSGSTSVLQRMNRGYTREDYLEKVTILRDLMPDIALSTDIIVGFPGETQEEFEQTLRLLEDVRFTNIFSFRYSPRPFTSASKLQDSVPFEVKKNRLIQVQKLQKRIQLEINSSCIGQTYKVLCTGRSKKDPCIYAGRNQAHQVVNFKAEGEVIPEFLQVRITSCGPYSLFGVVV